MKRKLVSFVLVGSMVTSLMPATALAGTENSEGIIAYSEPISVSTADELQQQITAASSGPVTIQLTSEITLDQGIEIPSGVNITLDLNGKSISVPAQKVGITVSGTLTLLDGSAEKTGAVSAAEGSSSEVILVKNSGKFTMNNGEISGSNTGIKTEDESTVEILSGAVSTTDTNTGRAIRLSGVPSQLVLGSEGVSEGPTIQSIGTVANKEYTIQFIKGSVGAIIGADTVKISESSTFTEGFVFQSDIGKFLPEGYQCVAEAGHYVVVKGELNETTAAASVTSNGQTTYYPSAATAATALKDGDTLTLLRDHSGVAASGDGALKISQSNITLDLNGHNVTGTGNAESGSAIYVNVANEAVTTLTLKNSAEGTTSTLQGPIPLSVNGTMGFGYVDVKIEGPGAISNISTLGKDTIVLSGKARLPYSAAAAAMINNGGFSAIVDGQQYIYTSAGDAIAASDNDTATLLNDYSGTLSLSIGVIPDTSAIIDLNGHTYKQTSNADDHAALRLTNTNDGYEAPNIILEVKNGTIASAGDGVQILGDNITLFLDNVDISAEGAYGICTNGSNQLDNLLIRNASSINVPNGIGIYWPSGAGSMDNSYITAHTGLQICGGNFSIDSGDIDEGETPSTITATGTPIEKDGTDGGILDGAAISIIDREGYPDITTVAVHEATIIAAEGNQAVKAYSYNDTTKEVGEFVNDESIGTNVMISTGNYSTLVPHDLLTMNVEAEIYSPDDAVTPYSYYRLMKDAKAAAGPKDIIVDTLNGSIDPKARYDVTVNYSDGSTAVASVSKGAAMLPPTQMREGYTFLGWSDGTTTYNSGEWITVNGAMTLTAQWEENVDDPSDEPSTPSGPSTPSQPSEPEQPAPDVTTDEGTSTTTTTAKPAVTTSGTTASATVSEAMGEAIVEQVTENESNTVVIAPDMDNDITEAEVVVPAGTVEALGDDTDADLVIDTPVGKVTLPNNGLSVLAKDTDDITVSLKADDDTVEFVIADDAGAVATVNGGVKLVVPADTKAGTVAVIVNEDGTREVVRKSVASDDNMIIPLDGSAIIEIIDNSKDFVDVAENSWYGDAVAFASSHELFNGTSATEFSPDAGMTRGMLAAVLSNLERGDGSDLDAAFDDVDDDAWYAEAIAWAAENGIVNGLGNGMFGPEELITREQMAAMLYNYADMLGVDTSARANLNAYSDANSVSSWANEVMSWANATGIIGGTTTTTLDPQGTATRAQVAAMLERFVLLIAE